MENLRIEWARVALLCFVLVLPGSRRAGAEMSVVHPQISPITVSIQMEKDAFIVGEPVAGKVVLDNRSPRPLPGVFQVQLFHEDRLVSQTTISIPQIPIAVTKFSFSEFSIPHFNRDAGAQGGWTLVILQQGLDPSQATKAVIHVVPAAEK